MKQSRSLKFTGSRPIWFPDLGHMEPGKTIEVDEETAERLLTTTKCFESVSKKTAKEEAE